jgi:hypothetical protein
VDDAASGGLSDDLPRVVDCSGARSVNLIGRVFRVNESRVSSVVFTQECARPEVGIKVVADDLTVLIDAQGACCLRAGDVEDQVAARVDLRL